MNTLFYALLRKIKSIGDTVNGINFYTLLKYQQVTTTATEVTLPDSNKFSDYDLIVGQIIDVNKGYFRSFSIIPLDLLKEHPVSMSYTDSAKNQYWIELTYISDTVVKVQSSSSANNYFVCLQGIKL